MYFIGMTFKTEEYATFNRDQIKSLSFAPEYDPTLSTLPMCEFEAEVVDAEHSEADMLEGIVHISENYNGHKYIATGYHIVTATRKSPTLMYFKAQSNLKYLNNITLPAKYYSDTTTVDVVLQDILEGANPSLRYTLKMRYNSSKRIDPVYLPAQSARERLLWLCQAYGLYVIQWGEKDVRDSALYFREAEESLDTSSQNSFCNIIPIEQTFDKPTIKKVQVPDVVSYAVYSRFYDKKPTTTGYNWQTVEEPLLDEDGAYAWVDLDTGEYSKKLYYYYQNGSAVYRTDSDNGSESSITGNYLITNETKMSNLIKNAWFREYEVELDILGGLKKDNPGLADEYDSDQYFFMPGDDVMVYTDPKTAYRGRIKSARFTFGTICRQKLVISTDLKPVELHHLEIRYVYKQGEAECVLGRRDYYLKHDIYYSYDNPSFTKYVVNRLERFTPQTSRVLVRLTEDTSVTVYYNRAN